MSNSKIKILYITNTLGRGGKERRLVELLNRISTNKSIISSLIILDPVIQYKQIYKLDNKLIILGRKIKKDPMIFYRLFKLCKKWKPDIIHAWDSMSAVYSVPISKLFQIKLINAMITDAPKKLSLKKYIRSKLTFPFTDIIQSNSYAGLSAYSVNNKGHVIHNGFDFNRLKNLTAPESIRHKFKIKTKYVVGMVARFHGDKDYYTFLKAATNLINNRSDISFLLVGDGAQMENYRQNFQDNRIIFTGRQNDVESIINIFDIGVLLTNLDIHGEGISNSIMEYMALGKPVIATNGGGTNEVVTNGESGFLIPQNSIKMLVNKIILLLNNQEIREELGKKGREYISKKFNIETMIAKHLKIYNHLT